MGRKPLNKERKHDNAKKEEWRKKLLPYFKENGFLGFSMDDVARFLGISKATIYNHFTSKDEIIELYLENKVSELDLISDKFENSASFTNFCEQYLEQIMLVMLDVSIVIRQDLKLNYPDKWLVFENALQKSLNKLGKLYQQGIKKGFYRKVNVDLLLLSDFDMLLRISDNEILLKGKENPKQIFQDYLQIRNFGLINN